MSDPSIYRGISRRLVISLDIGTTFSGISYCILAHGEVPKVCNVSRFPGQEHVSGSCKIPTVLCYDKSGRMRAAGAEALLAESSEHVEDGEWIKVEWFKLRLHPLSIPPEMEGSSLPPIPANKSLIDIYSDFLAYLQSCAEIFILDTHAYLANVWANLRDNAIFFLCHPNIWNGVQQSMMRQAAILARLVPSVPEGRARVKFVTEGEASLHCCLHKRILESNELDSGFIVADLGGGTLDFSAYKVTGTKPLRIEEVSSPRCEPLGSTLVTMRARAYIKDKLMNSRYGTDEHAMHIAERFDETVKKTFKGPDDLCVVPFGTVADKDPAHDIKSGKLKINGEDVASFFEPSILGAITAIIELISSSDARISSVYAVGGFSASPYVISQLKGHLGGLGVTVHSLDGQSTKAAADGAVLVYFNQFISTRVARMTYGVPISWNCDDPQCPPVSVGREAIILPSGAKVLCGGFRPLLSQGTTTSKEKEFRCSIYKEVLSAEEASFVSMDLLAYKGSGPPPDWIDEPETRHLFSKLCTISAFLPPSKALIRSIKRRKSEKFWRVRCDFVLLFGGAEMQAQIVCFEKGAERRTSAEVVYEDSPGTFISQTQMIQMNGQVGVIPARDSESAALLSRY